MTYSNITPPPIHSYFLQMIFSFTLNNQQVLIFCNSLYKQCDFSFPIYDYEAIVGVYGQRLH